jgi:ActR/RegA family two-component response regulator
VLVVDEHKRWLEWYGHYLRGHGFEPVFARRASRTRFELGRRSFCAAICEVRMGRDGFLYPLIRQIARALPHTHFVVVTACGSLAGELDALDGGVVAYFDKPSLVERTLATPRLLRALRGRRALPLGESGRIGDPMSMHRVMWEKLHSELRDRRWNVSATADAMRVSRSTLKRWLSDPPPPIGRCL